MLQRITPEEDSALKRISETPSDEKPVFAWREVIPKDYIQSGADVLLRTREGAETPFRPADIADVIGGALTDLLLAREEEEIFTPENRALVSDIVRTVGDRLNAMGREGRSVTFSENDLYLLIEKALIEARAYDVAKSLVFRRGQGVAGAGGGGGADSPGTGALRLIRRNNKVVPWRLDKIEGAVRRAFLSLELDAAPSRAVAEAVTERLLRAGQSFVHIEDVQDLVQEELMRQGHYKVAEAYILYRAHRARLRAESAEEARSTGHQEMMLVVKEADGRNEFWDGLDLKKRIEFALIGLDLCLSEIEIEQELRRSLYPEISREDLRRTIILNAKSLIERDADFARFAGRILLTYLYEEVLGWSILGDGVESLREFHRRGFLAYLDRAQRIGRLNPQLLDYDLGQLADALDPTADLDFDYLGIQTLYDRYLIVDKTVRPARRLETPQFFWMRVAMGLYLLEDGDREQRVTELYSLYKNRRFCSSTPTLFNSGTPHSQLSSCYLYKVDDSIESIMQRGVAENAYLSKWAGGLGGSWTSVRGTGSHIQGTNGESQGVIPFLKLHNDQLVAVNQGGKRRGSGCAYLETWHNDIADFLELRKNTGDDRRRTHDMNTANWIPDLFMKRMEARADWSLFRASETPDLHELYGKAFEERYLEYEEMAAGGGIHRETVPAIDLWKKMLRMIFETGHPWITFKDPCNVRSPQDHVGVIHSSNLCTEITLNTSAEETAVCNLGSIVLDNHITDDGAIDHARLRETVRVAVRALDNVIDINFYPTDAARTANLRHRPVGLGVMGLQNALFKRGLAFASDEAVDFNDELLEAVAHYAYEASSDLAAERGPYPTYQGSKWDRGLLPQDTLDLLEDERGEPVEVPRGGRMDWAPVRAKIARQGMRNSNVLAIAPTATISNIMGTTPCIEPNYKNLFVKSNLSGEFIVLNAPLVRDLKRRGLWNQDMLDQIKYFDGELADIPEIPEDLKLKYRTVFDIPYSYVVDAAARRQKWIDQSQSVNLFLAEPDMKTLSHMYRRAWRCGLKTTYYLRTLGASNIEKATVSTKKEIRGAAAPPATATDPDGHSPPSPSEKQACAIDAMLHGGECEACQ